MAPRAYTARAELIVRMGDEYVYQPTTACGGGAGATPDMQTVVNAEMRLIGSGAVVRRAIEAVGMAIRFTRTSRARRTPRPVKIAAAERAFAENLTR